MEGNIKVRFIMFESFFSTPVRSDIMPTSSIPTSAIPSMMYGSMYGNTNFLGGTTMAPCLTRDVYCGVKTEEFKNHIGLKNTLMGTGILLVGSVILGKFTKLGKGLAGLFKSGTK